MIKKLSAIPTAVTLFLAHGQIALGANTSITLEAPQQAEQLENVKVENIPQFLITLLFIIGIVISVVFLIYGGIKWILSGGDSKQVEGARNHIVAAIVGLIIVVGAFLILNIVFTILTGEKFEFGKLCIPSLVTPNCN